MQSSKNKWLIGLLVITAVSLLGNVVLLWTNHNTKLVADTNQIKVSAQLTKTQTELAVSKKKLTAVQQALTNSQSEQEKTFKLAVEGAFNALYNYSPTTYNDRKQKSEPYLSAKLMQDYFPAKQSSYTGNLNSQIEVVKLYPVTVQGQTMSGIAETTYKSGYVGGSQQEHVHYWKVTFDSQQRKITEIKDLTASQSDEN